jgi:methionyl-tRNA formyltransferase
MKVVFMGTPQAAVQTLERLVADRHEVVAVYTQPDRPSGRGNKITFSPVKQFALDRGIQVLQPTKIKTVEALEEFKAHNADVVVVVAYGRILPESFLTAFPKGAVNVHFSLLPKYRGAAPVNWAIARGETITGVTTMQMDAGLDTGNILLQRESKIGAAETAPELMERLSFDGAELLSETLRTFDIIAPSAQEEADASYAPILKREDGVIEWDRSAKEISDRVRGFQPFPSSFSYRNGRKVTIWRTAVRDSANAELGTVASIDKETFDVACGDGSGLSVLEIQPEGKRRMSAADFVNGMRLKVGDRFTS